MTSNESMQCINAYNNWWTYDFIKDNHYVLSKLHELKELLNGEL